MIPYPTPRIDPRSSLRWFRDTIAENRRVTANIIIHAMPRDEVFDWADSLSSSTRSSVAPTVPGILASEDPRLTTARLVEVESSIDRRLAANRIADAWGGRDPLELFEAGLAQAEGDVEQAFVNRTLHSLPRENLEEQLNRIKSRPYYESAMLPIIIRLPTDRIERVFEGIYDGRSESVHKEFMGQTDLFPTSERRSHSC